MQVGFDEKHDRKGPLDKRHKHYRYCLKGTYEEYYKSIYGEKMGTFSEVNIRKGRVFPGHDNASSVVRKIATEDTYVGIFKGDCFITKVDNIKDEEENKFN